MWFLIPIGLTIGLLGLCVWGFIKDLNHSGPAGSKGMDYMQENARQELYKDKIGK